MSLSNAPYSWMERGNQPRNAEDVAVAFVSGSRAHANSPRVAVSMATQDGVRAFYSYFTPVALQLPDGTYAASARSYSSTTARHQDAVHMALWREGLRVNPYRLIDAAWCRRVGWNHGDEPWQAYETWDIDPPRIIAWEARTYDIVPITDDTGTYSHAVRNHGRVVAYAGLGGNVYVVGSKPLPQYVQRGIAATCQPSDAQNPEDCEHDASGLYKVVSLAMHPIYADPGFIYAVGEWTEYRHPVQCASGWHVTSDPILWCRDSTDLVYRVRVAGTHTAMDDGCKQAFAYMMLVGEPVTVAQWCDGMRPTVNAGCPDCMATGESFPMVTCRRCAGTGEIAG